MLGAIIGDIIGSVYEWHNIKTKDFPLFRDDCFFTDDTVMTIAVAEAIMKGGERDDFIDAMKKYGRMYPDAGYGGRFRHWLFTDDRKPYNSFGNGSAMRVSPCAWVMDCGFCARTGMWPSNGRAQVRLSAEVTHDHPEGIKGAMAVADAIFMCRYYFGGYCGDWETPINDDPAECKKRIKEHIEQEYGYDLSKTLDEIRPTYRFDVSCQGTVPPAIIAFLESTDFEDAIRNAISLGGDSDTLAAITGSIAEAAYGIPNRIKEKALTYLDEPLKDVLKHWGTFNLERKRNNMRREIVLDAKERPKFNTIYETINYVTGREYAGWMKACWPAVYGAEYTNFRMWFPKLSKIVGGKYTSVFNCVNTISENGDEITFDYLGKPWDPDMPQYRGYDLIFAKEPDNGPYVFRGLFVYDDQKADPKRNHCVSKRIATKVKVTGTPGYTVEIIE